MAKTIYDLQLHEILEVHQEPYFRVMRVDSGLLYNLYNVDADRYIEGDWTFVPLVRTEFNNKNNNEPLPPAMKSVLIS